MKESITPSQRAQCYGPHDLELLGLPMFRCRKIVVQGALQEPNDDYTLWSAYEDNLWKEARKVSFSFRSPSTRRHKLGGIALSVSWNACPQAKTVVIRHRWNTGA